MKLISGFIDSYLRLSSEEEERFQGYIEEFQPQQQEEVMEIVTSWMEQGQKGEAITLILKQLSRRVGKITPELETAIRSLSLTQLEDLAEALLDFDSLQDLQQWLRDN